MGPRLTGWPTAAVPGGATALTKLGPNLALVSERQVLPQATLAAWAGLVVMAVSMALTRTMPASPPAAFLFMVFLLPPSIRRPHGQGCLGT